MEITRTNSRRLARAILGAGILLCLQGENNTPTMAQAACHPQIDHVEFTQGVQTDPVPTVSLVDRRTTTLRVYVKPSEDCSRDTITVQGEKIPIEPALRDVEAKLDVFNIWIPNAESDNGPLHVLSDPPFDRELNELTKYHPSFNFTFYATQMYDINSAGGIVFGICLSHLGECRNEPDASMGAVADFEARGNPIIAAVPLSYDPPGGPSVSAPSLQTVQTGRRGGLRMWPFSGGSFYRVQELSDDVVDFELDDVTNRGVDQLHNRLEIERLSRSPAPDCMYGWLGPGVFRGGASPAAGDTRCLGFGEDIDGYDVFAHELGHHLFQIVGHPPPNSGRSEVGWEPVGASKEWRVKRLSYHPLMSQGTAGTLDMWIDLPSYLLALGHPLLSQSQPISQLSTFHLVTGQFTSTAGLSYIDPVVDLVGDVAPTPTPGGSIELRSLGDGGETIYSTYVFSVGRGLA